MRNLHENLQESSECLVNLHKIQYTPLESSIVQSKKTKHRQQSTDFTHIQRR